MHFETDGETILKDSEEAKVQEEITDQRVYLIKETVKQHEMEDMTGNYDLYLARKILRNKFNYNERQSQTPNAHIKEQYFLFYKIKQRGFDCQTTIEKLQWRGQSKLDLRFIR